MQCSYCNIAYALADPNCRGCGAPKTADAVRRGLDSQMRSGGIGRGTRADEDRDHGFISHLERLQRLGPFGIVALVITILGIVSIIGAPGLMMLAIFIPKLLTAKAEWNTAMLDQRERR